MYSYREQKRLMEELKTFTRKFSSRDLYEYNMLLKRHKDEEEFDSVSFKKLQELHKKYYNKKDPRDFDHLFKKPSSEGGETEEKN